MGRGVSLPKRADPVGTRGTTGTNGSGPVGQVSNWLNNKRRAHNVCDLCAHEARGFAFQKSRNHVEHFLCSIECQDAVYRLYLDGGLGMLKTPTEMEKQAISDARQPLYEALVKIGKAEVMDHFTKEDVLTIIEAAWDGVRESMQRQIGDEIPF